MFEGMGLAGGGIEETLRGPTISLFRLPVAGLERPHGALILKCNHDSLVCNCRLCANGKNSVISLLYSA